MSNDIFKPVNINYLTYPYGLVNTGSLCYLNSIIQSLTSCSIFNEYMLTNKEKFITDNNTLAVYFINIISSNLNNSSNTIINENINILKEIIRLKRKNNNKFNFLGQQDVSECITFIIESLNDNNIYKMFYHKYKCDILCSNCKYTSSIQDDISYQFEISMNEKINILSKNIRLNISQLVDYKCEQCKNINNCNKINRLQYIPPILIINLNKYFNKELYDFKKNLIFYNDDIKKKYIYTIVSIIEHGGNQFSGHYISKSIKKSENNKIKAYLCNDSHYIESNLNPALNSYLLFYNLIKIE